ncbi:unnamed protein product [Penicillium olsonii]|uniref:Uncharacterized protein n=1 Tax=Penicillium olsonii TaxID=99116 RepID=A0A9W4HK00_PENOL|nr:unnamed protein product [Penicillium olsonii]CAG7918730.1 unnamed protein product [Penicillium olsonii]CAG8040128.1 unnamed protein product [Penicillium olsonii]CAG8047759.1 unnamed protein product [Penicillium olsonii]CAG8061779.1 unnamed protein product [Penicillium olsonii]
MVLGFLIRGLEVWLTLRLLRSPIFHRMVGRVHQRVQYHRHGVPLPPKTPKEELGGSHHEADGFDFKKFFGHFKEEFKDQLNGRTKNKY